MAEALGLGVALWSPLGGGLLTGKYRESDAGRLTDWIRLIHRRSRWHEADELRRRRVPDRPRCSPAG
jgi:aryl-alcohol dehydrogenase-like predicted oxidoreductase